MSLCDCYFHSALFSQVVLKALSTYLVTQKTKGKKGLTPSFDFESFWQCFCTAAELPSGLQSADDALFLGSVDIMKDVEELLNDKVELLVDWKEAYIDLVQVRSCFLLASICKRF
jgi:hypothetical protein